jgi:hypothetical protein
MIVLASGARSAPWSPSACLKPSCSSSGCAARAILFQIRSARLRSIGISWRQTATLRTSCVTRHTLQLPAGKNAVSPGPSRRSVLIDNEDLTEQFHLTRKDVHHLTDQVSPAEPAFGARPNDYVHGPVATLSYFLCVGLWAVQETPSEGNGDGSSSISLGLAVTCLMAKALKPPGYVAARVFAVHAKQANIVASMRGARSSRQIPSPAKSPLPALVRGPAQSHPEKGFDEISYSPHRGHEA